MAARAAADATDKALLEFERRLWGRPAKWEDLPLLAEACFTHLWPGYVLDQPESDALLAKGMDCVGGVGDEALAALLRAIRDLALFKGRHDDPQTFNAQPDAPPEMAPQSETASACPIHDPVHIEFDPQEFARRWLLLGQIAIKLLAKDEAGLRAYVEDTFSVTRDGMSGDDVLEAFLSNLEALRGKLTALAHFADVARYRILALAIEEGEDG